MQLGIKLETLTPRGLLNGWLGQFQPEVGLSQESRGSDKWHTSLHHPTHRVACFTNRIASQDKHQSHL